LNERELDEVLGAAVRVIVPMPPVPEKPALELGETVSQLGAAVCKDQAKL
jgi:hypothetical protein